MTLPLIFFISFCFGFRSGIADVPSVVLPAWETGLRIKDSSQILTISTDGNGAIELEVKPKRSDSSERSVRYFSQDGLKFTKPHGEVGATGLLEADAGRVVELAHERGQKLRRYFVNTRQNWVQSELSEDGGATYRLEAGYRVGRPSDGAKFLEPILVWKTARDVSMLFLKRERAGLVIIQKYTSRGGRSFKLEKSQAVGFPSSSAAGALMKRSDEIWYFAPTGDQGVSVFISSDGGESFVEQNELALKAPLSGSGLEIEKIESLHAVEVKDGVRLYVGALLKKNHGRKNAVLSVGYLKSQ